LKGEAIRVGQKWNKIENYHSNFLKNLLLDPDPIGTIVYWCTFAFFCICGFTMCVDRVQMKVEKGDSIVFCFWGVIYDPLDSPRSRI